jgi:probable H4MPT-linked C1 transfer pathway protein
MERWRQAASSNWHALARYCGRFARHGTALLIDVGSTTVDIIPLRDGQLVHQAATDLDRLLAGELVYTGMERTPVCALARTLPHGDVRCPVAPELFATTRDVHLLLGNLAEDAEDRHTADHEPATREAAHRRMARMLCADKDQISSSEVQLWAREIAEAQLLLLIEAATRVLDRLACSPSTMILTGHGEALSHQLLQRLSWTGTIVSLRDRLAPALSRCAPAHALAMLARESAGG